MSEKTKTILPEDKPNRSDLILPSEKFKSEIQSDGSVMESFKKKKKYIDQKYISEKSTARFNTPLMVSGNIYIFDYDSVNKKVIHDRKPIVYSIGQVKSDKGVVTELGINLNLIPIKFKVAILDRLFEATRTLQTTFTNQKRIGYFPVDKDFIDRVLRNTGYHYALWHWLPQKINNKIVIDYNDWYVALHMLPYELKGINLSDLERNYLKNLSLK